MAKFCYKSFEIKNKIIKHDIEFNFEELKTKNPKLCGKTPMWLYSVDFLKKYLKNK